MSKIKTIVTLIFIIVLAANLCLNNFDFRQDDNNNYSSVRAEFVNDEASFNPTTRSLVGNNKLTLLSEGQGAMSNDNYGLALTAAGDLNSDGFDDIVLCAPYADPLGKTNAGEAYIFFGAEDFALNKLDAQMANVKISCNNAEELFGKSICMPGDINNDNINDIIIGAPGAGGERGKIYIFYSSTITSGSNISANSADLIIQGSSNGEKFGTVVSAIGDVNSDQVNDIMVGAPGDDKAYILYGPTFGSSERTVLKGPKGSSFGTAVSGGTDLNNDGHFDFVVSAPVGVVSSGYKGQIFLFYGYSNFYTNKIVSNENNTLLSNSANNLFGESLTSQIDIDKDGYYDIIVGAPADDSVFVYYGKTLTDRYSFPYLWNMPGDSAQPVDFTSGVYNDVGSNLDVNTYGLGKGNDGWDWEANVFGSSVGADMDHIYGAWEEKTPPYADADGVDYGNNSRLEVIVGRSNTQLGPTWNWWQDMNGDSGAWGIEFTISSSMYENISNGANVYLEFDWEAHDAMKVFGNSGGTEERCYVKARFSSSTTSTFLGTDSGGDSTAELFYSESSMGLGSPFQSASEHFSSNINNLIDSDGNYYLELGARLEAIRGSNKGNTEGIVAFFDNISIYAENLPITHSIKIKGGAQSQFGQSLAILNDLNGDGVDEIAIGAPYSNLAGTNAGAVYIIYGGSTLRSDINSNEAQRIITGLNENENFGIIFGEAGNVNGDMYDELIIGAPGYSNWLGKIYVFSLCQKPEILITNPSGGEIIEGDLNISVNAKDYENEMDKFGVTFYYSEYKKDEVDNWVLISKVPNPIGSNEIDGDIIYRYSFKWDTSGVPDGLYKIKVYLMDNSYLTCEAVSELFEINNPDKPVVEILSPKIEDKTFTGIMTIEAKCTDSDDDLNFTTFYYSNNSKVWNYIGIDYIEEDSVFQVEWDTEDITDGSYFVKARANDSRGQFAEAVSVRFKIHNPGGPTIGFIEPTINDTLKGYSTLKVIVKDKDDNIASPGVVFSYSRDRTEWIEIDSISDINPDLSYSTFWDTLKIQDGFYYLKAYVMDTTNLSAEVILGPIKLDNPSPPVIQLEPLVSPLAGKVKLKASCFDDDSDLSSEGVTFYISTDAENWIELGNTILNNAQFAGQNRIFILEWDTTTDDTPDGHNYRIRATVQDKTGLEGEIIIGPLTVNNPDGPTITLDRPKTGDKLKGQVMLGAYAEDPDNDIDQRGVSFYFSMDGVDWYLIDNAMLPVENSTLYQYKWDTTKLPNGDYHIKAEVIDSNALRAEAIAIIKINNPVEEEPINVSSNYWVGSIFFIIIIVLLIIFMVFSILKRRKILEKRRAREERKELVKSIRDEILREQSRYPVLQVSPTGTQLPALPVSTAAAAAAGGVSPGPLPMLPPYQPTEADKAAEATTKPTPTVPPTTTTTTTPGTESTAGIGGTPSTPSAQPGPSVHIPGLKKQTTEPGPKLGLTPDETTAEPSVKGTGKVEPGGVTPVQSTSPAPGPTPAPIPPPTPAPTPAPIPSIKKPDNETSVVGQQQKNIKPLNKNVDDSKGGD